MSINISNTFGKQNKLIIFIIIICYFKLYLFIFGTNIILIFFYTFGEGGNIYILFIYLRVLLMIILL